MARKASRNNPKPEAAPALPNTTDALPEVDSVVAYSQLLNGPTTRTVPATVVAVDEKADEITVQLMTPNKLKVSRVKRMTKGSQWKCWRYPAASELQSWGLADS